ncbi:ATP-binding protein [Legionella lytica]|uniref:ATP-binding protein n=1 Tax=Legionella lytica TaxID=96232 RepID=A0ABW8DBT1_9GAMM
MDPFEQGQLNEIFKTSPIQPNLLTSRESSILEFKESFGLKSLASYLKSCASFANNRGGYLIFGIKNKPHLLEGLNKSSLEKFENLDPELLSQHFNSNFSPEIEWDINLHQIGEQFFGILYIYESKQKPVICTKTTGDQLKEGDIYYRYRGRTERIKFPELRTILEESRENEQKLWMMHLQKITKIGVNNAGIFDLKSGVVSGSSGSFVIDRSLLSQLSFIKEGEFSECQGKPTLKLLGKIEPVDPKLLIGRNKIIKTRVIRIADIILDFLDHKNIDTPEDYVKQIGHEITAYLPIFYYMHKAGLTKDYVLELFRNDFARTRAKEKLMERIASKKTEFIITVKTDSTACKSKHELISHIKERAELKFSNIKEITYCLQAIKMLPIEDISSLSNYLRLLLKDIFESNYNSGSSPLVNEMRKSICWIDEALYKNLIS